MKKTIIMLFCLSMILSVSALVTDTRITTEYGNFTNSLYAAAIYDNGVLLSNTYAPLTGFSAENITSGTFADARISSAATWNAKAQTGASAVCAYGIANITTSSSGVPTVTCSAQQGTSNLIDVTSANTYIEVTGTTNKTLTFSETVLNATIATALATTYYNVTSVGTVTGTPQGALSGIQVEDLISYNVSEASSDMDFRMNVTRADLTTFNQIIIEYNTSSTEVDVIDVQVWEGAEWESYGHLTGTGGLWAEVVFTSSDGATHVIANNMQIRFVTTNIGSRTDKWKFDRVTVTKGVAAASGTELDPHAIYRDGTKPLTANWNAGEFNITAQDILVDEAKISGGFGSAGITMTDGSYWGDGNIYILGNLTAVNVNQVTTNGSIIPTPTNTYHLGNSSNVWLDAYATTFYQNGATLASLYAPIAVGNWAGNQSVYINTTQLDNTTIIRTVNGSWIVAAVGNWSGNISSYQLKTAANVTYNGNGTAGYIRRTTNTTNENNSIMYDNGSDVKINGYTILINSGFNAANLTSGNVSLIRGGTGTTNFIAGVVVSLTDTSTVPLTTISYNDNYLAKWKNFVLNTSIVYDNGTYVGIGTTAPDSVLDVHGNINSTGNISISNCVTLAGFWTVCGNSTDMTVKNSTGTAFMRFNTTAGSCFGAGC